MATWSSRAQGACPNCSTTYSSRWKPSNCSKCGFELGGSAPVSKAQKMCCPPALNICGGLYSIRTSSTDDRCLVYSENNLWICLHPDCKGVRAAYVLSDRNDVNNTDRPNTTPTVRAICTFAFYFSVFRPFCCFTLVYEGHFVVCYKEKTRAVRSC